MSGGADKAVPQVVEEVLDPSAPTTAAAPVDLPRVAPPSGATPAWLPWIALAGAFCVGVLSVAARQRGGVLWQADETVHAWILTQRTETEATIARVVTVGGITTVALPALAVVGALLPRAPRSLRTRLGAGMLLAGTASLGVWLGLLLNHAVGRERPPVADWWGAAGGPAFPSGHTTAATIVALTCAWALMPRAHSTRSRSLVWAGAAAYALAVGWSRMWLGVHWPGDVVGGWLFGAAWVALVVPVVGLARRRWRPAPPDAGARATGSGSLVPRP